MRDRIHESQLDNGLKVLTVENPVSPTASLQIWYRVGSRNERTGITGASHIFEHMMFKGTERYPKGVFDRIIQENGMTNNAFTSYDYTAYFENMAKDRLEVAFELEADRMQGLLLQPEEFESEISVIREERRQTREDPPFGLITEAVDAAVFQAHPYHWPVIGWMTDLETITREDLIAYYKVYYRPNNATLVVVGDVSHGAVLELAKKHFGGIARGPEVPAVRVVEPEQLGERSVSVHKEVQLPGVVIAYRAPEAAHADAAAMNIAEYILFRGRSSRLYQRLIYQEPLAVDLSGGFYLRKDPSTFVDARDGAPRCGGRAAARGGDRGGRVVRGDTPDGEGDGEGAQPDRRRLPLRPGAQLRAGNGTRFLRVPVVLAGLLRLPRGLSRGRSGGRGPRRRGPGSTSADERADT